jgi:hypothetical protein
MRALTRTWEKILLIPVYVCVCKFKGATDGSRMSEMNKVEVVEVEKVIYI